MILATTLADLGKYFVLKFNRFEKGRQSKLLCTNGYVAKSLMKTKLNQLKIEERLPFWFLSISI